MIVKTKKNLMQVKHDDDEKKREERERSLTKQTVSITIWIRWDAIYEKYDDQMKNISKRRMKKYFEEKK